MISAGFPIDCDASQNLCAFVYTELNKESTVSSMLTQLEESAIGKYVYMQAASKIVNFGHQSLETIQNFMSV